METVRVDLPSALLKAANVDAENPSHEAARLLALELYREEKISLQRAAELCGTPLAAFMDSVVQHDVPILRYSAEELEEERRSLARLQK